MKNKNKLIASIIIASVTIGAGTYYNYSQHDTVASADVINSNDAAKTAIQDKMVNSIDYFQSAKGSFTYYAKVAKINQKIDFDVNLKDQGGSFFNIKNAKGENKVLGISDGKKVMEANISDKSYRLGDSLEMPSKAFEATPAKLRYLKDANGNVEGVQLRKDPVNMGIATEVLFSQNIALGFLEDYSKWKIEQDEEYLGLSANVITGEVPNDYKGRHGSSKFKMWVHKDTGILLNFEEFNDQNEKVVNIKIDDIKLNQPTDPNKFKIQEPTGFKRIQ